MSKKKRKAGNFFRFHLSTLEKKKLHVLHISNITADDVLTSESIGESVALDRRRRLIPAHSQREEASLDQT